MEQSEEVEDVVTNFVSNMHYITWKPRQLSKHLGDADYQGPREWLYSEVRAPLDVAQIVHDFAHFIAKHPLPWIPHVHRSGRVNREEVVAHGKLLHDYMDIIQLTPKQLAHHCRCSRHAVREWWHGRSSTPDYLVTALYPWVQWIQSHPFPQYRKGPHGGARYRHTNRATGCTRVLP